MKKFLDAIISNPIAAILFIFIVLIGGTHSLFHMPVDLFPHLDVPVLNIITHYKSAAPEDIELLITRPVESVMMGIPGIKRVSSTSAQGVSHVTVEFNWNITIKEARSLVQARLSKLKNALPVGVYPRLENIGTTLQEVCYYIFYGTSDLVELRNTIKHEIATRLMKVNGISSIEVLGGEKRAFFVSVDPLLLAHNHLSIQNVINTIKKTNNVKVAGYLNRSGEEYLIRCNSRIKTIYDLKSIPIGETPNTPLMLDSISKIYQGYAPKHYVVKGNRLPAVAIIVRKQPGSSTVSVARGVGNMIKKLKVSLPPNCKVEKVYDQSEIIFESKKEIWSAMIVGAILAIGVLWFFLGHFRPTWIVSITIPLTLLATVLAMNYANLGFNVITFTALTLAIGMVVDDAIVVAENIQRYRSIYPNPVNAIIKGTIEIAGPDASGTFTTVAAFLPLLWITGIASLFLKPFGFTISAALLFSLFISLTLVPLFFSLGTQKSGQKTNFFGHRLIKLFDKGLENILDKSFDNKFVAITLALCIIILGIFTLVRNKVSLLPPIDEGSILVEYILPPGTSLKESDRIGDMLDKIALSDPATSCVYRRTGSSEKSYQIEQVNRGEVMIKLKPLRKRKRDIKQIIAHLKASFSVFNGVVFLYHQPTQEKIDESFSGLPSIFGITVYGDNMQELIFLANKVEKVISQDKAISNIVNNYKIKRSEIKIRLNQSAIGQYGVNTTEVLDTTRAAGLGVEATRIIRQREDVPIIVKIDTKNVITTKQLGQLPILTIDGSLIPLSKVAEISIQHTPPLITRLNGQRQITLVAEIEGNIPSIVARLRKKLQSIYFPRGYSYDFTGQYKTLTKTANEIIVAIFSSIIFIYLIMVMQLKSWLEPFLILLIIPFSISCALLALFFFHQGLDISVGMGMLTLVGVSVNNGIILIDFANRMVRKGDPPLTALKKAASIRLRPIILTSFTTIAALLPTAIGLTEGVGIFHPFSITIIAGLAGGLFATLVILPTSCSFLPGSVFNSMVSDV